MLVSNGFVVLIKQTYDPLINTPFVIAYLYKFNGTHLNIDKSFKKSGYLVGAL